MVLVNCYSPRAISARKVRTRQLIDILLLIWNNLHFWPSFTLLIVWTWILLIVYHLLFLFKLILTLLHDTPVFQLRLLYKLGDPSFSFLLTLFSSLRIYSLFTNQSSLLLLLFKHLLSLLLHKLSLLLSHDFSSFLSLFEFDLFLLSIH